MAKLHIILTCDGGSGHKSAAAALRAKALAVNDVVQEINTTRTGWFRGGGLDISYRYDFLFYKGLLDLGPIATKYWDWAQRTSHIELLRFFASLRRLSSLSIPSFRYRTYHLLKDRLDINDHSEVIFHNTQPNCLQTLVFSIARYNREVKAYNLKHPGKPKNTVKLINHFTDMPTIQAKMFIEEIAKIDVADLNDAQFELHTRPPIVAIDNPSLFTEEELTLEYHKKAMQLYPNLYRELLPNTNRVKFIDGPIRSEFVFRKNNPAVKKDGITVKFTNESEYSDISASLNIGVGEFNPKGSHATIPLTEDTEIVSLMLGSQASIEGTLGVVKEEIKFANESSKTKYLFVYCGENKPREGLVLYGQVLKIAKKINTDPLSRIRIIPLSNQPASTIADVYSLADRVITRPGGISIMEIEAVVKKGKIFVFTELSKLAKLSNRLLSRSYEMLQEKFSKQESEQRFADLIAWEHGNALHAQNACKDSSGRTRIVPVNVYSFRNELEFFNKKEKIAHLISNQQYIQAFEELNTHPALNAFILTGNDPGVDLACLVEITQLYDQIGQKLSDLILKHKALETLENGPKDTLKLITAVRNTISTQLNEHVLPSKILKEVALRIGDVKRSLKTSIDTVRTSDIKNKSVIIRALERISRAFLNFFRFIFRLKPEYEPTAGLDKIQKDITSAIKRPSMSKIAQYCDESTPEPLTESQKEALQWTTVDKIIAELLQENPTQKNKLFIVRKEKYPALAYDFLYCGSADVNASECYRIGNKFSQGIAGLTSFLQNRLGATAVMKEHPFVENTEELHCLKKMGLYLGDGEHPDHEAHELSAWISIQKYVPGESLHDYSIQKKSGLFVEYKIFTEEKKIKIAVALATGLKNLMENGITHFDIAPPNIIMQEHETGQITATFIDFGEAQMKDHPRLRMKKEAVSYYAAPELIEADRLHEVGTVREYPCSDKSEIYALGIILKDLCIDPNLTEKMTHTRPEMRPSIDEVIAFLSPPLSPSDEVDAIHQTALTETETSSLAPRI
jgi:hypothetical protein